MLDYNSEFPRLPDEIEQWLEPQNLTAETIYMWRKYFPIAWGKPSPHLDGGIVNSDVGLMVHAGGEEKARGSNAIIEEREGRNAKRKRQVANAEQSAEWVVWHRVCTERKAAIEAASAEWRKRVAQRNKWMAESSLYVEEARVALQNAKLVPVPLQPGK